MGLSDIKEIPLDEQISALSIVNDITLSVIYCIPAKMLLVFRHIPSQILLHVVCHRRKI
jgi:hypothetical protein